MKNFIGLVVLAFLLSASTANAKGFYVQATGGANWDSVNDIWDTNVSSDTGFIVAGTLGTSIDAVPGLSIEGEVAFRGNDVHASGCIDASGRHDTTSVMANARYDILRGTIRPYVLAGIGYGSNKVSLDDTPLSVESQGFAWQVGTGVEYEVAKGAFLGVGYRYLQTPDVSLFGTQLSDGSNSSVVATARFTFE